MKQRWLLRCLKVASVALLACTLVTFVVMSLWNLIVPSIFNLKAITFWQALGLLVLSKLLFGSFRGFSSGGPRWRKRMAERWEKMTPEEREKLKEGMRAGCDFKVPA